MHILVTGSSGTIGTALCETLIANHRVTAVDRRPNRWNERLNAETLLVDLADSEQLRRLPEHVDMVIHLAANARVYDLVVKPELAYENILTTYNILEYVRRHAVERVIFASSREVYGSIPETRLVSEEMVDLTRCESPYTASKMAGEALIYSYGLVYGINHIVMRFSNVYGRYDDSSRVVPVWIRAALHNEPLVVFGPEKKLDFTYVDDAVDGIRRAVERFETARGRPINVSSGTSVELVSVAHMVRELTGSGSEIVIKPTRAGEVWTYQADLSRAGKLLGYVPTIDVKCGLRKSVDWYKAHLPE